MVVLAIVLVLLAGLMVATYLLGFRLGGQSSLEELTRGPGRGGPGPSADRAGDPPGPHGHARRGPAPAPRPRVSDPIKPWTNRLVEFAVSVLAAALMLSWAWALLRPLLPVLVIVGAALATVAVLAGYVIRRWHYW
jgi:hypothetical protein